MTTTRSPQRSALRWTRVVALVVLWAVLLRLALPAARWFVGLLPVTAGSRPAEVVEFFVFDVAKIVLLLTGVIFAVTVIRSFVTVEQTRRWLGGRGRVAGYALAAALGVLMPFCSCSAVPMFIGFVAAGVPLGITMTFLIASPLVNEVAVVLVAGSFGIGVAALYVATGLTVAITAGATIGRLRLERWVEPFVHRVPTTGGLAPGTRLTWSDRFGTARAEVAVILRRVWPYLLVGIGIGAVIHGWAPEDLFARWAGKDNPLAVPIAVVLGVPLYSNAAGTIPLIEALHAKGVALGTAIAFMMSVVALSLPEMVLLRRVLTLRLLATFVGVVAVGIMITGYVLNAVI